MYDTVDRLQDYSTLQVIISFSFSFSFRNFVQTLLSTLHHQYCIYMFFDCDYAHMYFPLTGINPSYSQKKYQRIYIDTMDWERIKECRVRPVLGITVISRFRVPECGTIPTLLKGSSCSYPESTIVQLNLDRSIEALQK